ARAMVEALLRGAHPDPEDPQQPGPRPPIRPMKIPSETKSSKSRSLRPILRNTIQVVMLGHDAIGFPIRGGEQRSHWIHRIYLDHAEAWNLDVVHRHDPRFLAAFRPRKRGLRAALSPIEAWIRRTPLALSRDLGRRPKTAARLRDRLEEDRRRIAAAHIVHFEHPFAYPFFEDRLVGKRIVYSSHNIESLTLLDYFGSDGARRFGKGRLAEGPLSGEARRLLARMARVEAILVRRSDLVLACTEEDARHYREIGAREVCVAPNGATPVPKAGVRSETVPPFERHALFVSSDWRPNAAALVRFCGDLDLPAGRGLVCAGTIGDSTHPGFERLRANASISFVGPVDASRLAALVRGARTLIVPAQDSAGGSNIKTAEALLSGKPVVMTPAALRGYEAFSDSPGVRVRETPAGFQKQIAADLEDGERTHLRPGVEALAWPRALAPAREALRRLVAEARAEVGAGDDGLEHANRL
ncbi:MAG TPA: glycosyltransferase, partial [Deltaproteobacteria bacterium]|nr:glycosyltransferase [Deltaproteobacteria bacterium]